LSFQEIRQDEESALRPDGDPFELERPYRRVFVHQPDPRTAEWVDVVRAYARAMTPRDDTCLLLPLEDRGQDEVSDTIVQSLSSEGLDPDGVADIMVVPDVSGIANLGQILAAADVVVPGSDAVQAARARRMGRPILRDTSPSGWRAALA
jgi:hypothetical protein